MSVKALLIFAILQMAYVHMYSVEILHRYANLLVYIMIFLQTELLF